MGSSRSLVSARTYALAFAVALSPALIQAQLTCAKTGDPTLSTLEVEVSGQNYIADFDPEDLSYGVSLPLAEDSATVRAYSTDPGSQVMYNYSSVPTGPIDYGSLPLGGGEFALDGLLPEGASRLLVSVKAPGKATYSYVVNIRVGCSDCDDGIACTTDTCSVAQQVCGHDVLPDGGGQCVFPCTEQGVRDAIMRGGGPHTFDCDGPTTVPVSAWIDVDKDVILDGEGNLTINSGPFQILPGVRAELHGFTLDGLGLRCSSRPPWVSPCFESPGIYNLGTLTMTDSTVRGWFAGVVGGAVTVTNSTVSGNDRGIISTSSLALTNSTVSGNMVGSGIEDFDALTLTNSTVSGNGGLGVFSAVGGATATVTNSTVLGNGDGGIVIVLGTTTVTNTIVDGDCGGTIVSLGYNIESPGDTCGFDQATDQVNVTAEQLAPGPLQDNGGPTTTHALLTEPEVSVAIDRIPAEDCVDADGEPLTTDQRGEPRPVAILGAEPKCDVGAFEVQP